MATEQLLSTLKTRLLPLDERSARAVFDRHYHFGCRQTVLSF